MVLNSLIQAARPLPVCPQAGHLSSGQPAADCGLQEPGGRGGEAAQGAIWLWKQRAWGDADEGCQEHSSVFNLSMS